MPFRKFFLWNALGGISWGVTYGLIGYYAGQGATNALATLGIIGGVILALTIIGMLISVKLRRQGIEEPRTARGHGAAERRDPEERSAAQDEDGSS
jgi:membrane protein DedA with SNARE-associated domain